VVRDHLTAYNTTVLDVQWRNIKSPVRPL